MGLCLFGRRFLDHGARRFNGRGSRAGSEATHIWDKTTKLRDAYDFLFFQQRTLFEFGAANRARGFSSVNAFRLLGLAMKQARLGRAYLESS